VNIYDSKDLKEIIKPLVDDIQGQEITVIVNRRAVLRSAKLAVSKPGFSFNRPVKIVFSGEDAVDEGGPRREFFRQVSVLYAFVHGSSVSFRFHVYCNFSSL